MPTAVAYARYSTSEQRTESVTAQLRAIHAYASKNGIDILREYIDEAKTGTTDDRPDFQRMIEEVRIGLVKPDLVLVHKTDRFARNRYDSAVYKRQLAQAGARVVAVDQPVDDSPEGALLESLLEGLAEYYSKNLARETLKGLKENAYQGRTTGGKPPLGYDVDADGRFVINEAEAVIVRRIFQEVLAGRTYKEIVEDLNREGYRTKYGNPFGKNSIHDILANEKYVGTYIFMRGSKRVHHGPIRKDAIILDGAIPAIISQEEFDMVREMMAARKNKNGPRKRSEANYILTGKIYCECGGRMIGQTISGKRGTYTYYRCDHAVRTRTCTNRSVQKSWLENAVLDEIESVLSPEMSRELAEKLVALTSEREADNLAEEKALQKELADIDRKLDNLVAAIEDGQTDYALIGSRMRQLKELRAQKIARLETLQAPQAGLTLEMVLAYIDTLRRHLVDRTDIQECQEIIARMVERITVHADKVEVVLRFGPPEKVLLRSGCGTPYLVLSKTIKRV